jgi:hypothetical protein
VGILGFFSDTVQVAEGAFSVKRQGRVDVQCPSAVCGRVVDNEQPHVNGGRRRASPKKGCSCNAKAWSTRTVGAGHLDGFGFCHPFRPSSQQMHPSLNNVCMLRGKSVSRLIGATLHWRVQRSPAWTCGGNAGGLLDKGQEVGWWGDVPGVKTCASRREGGTWSG